MDEMTAPVVKTNSSAKINTCMRHVAKAQKDLVRVIGDIENGQKYMDQLNEAIETLSAAPETSNLDKIFKLTEEVTAKSRFAVRAKSEKALTFRFQRASELLLRYAPKLDGASALVDQMEVLAETDLAKVEDLQPAFALCDEVFGTVNRFQNEEIVRKIDRSFNAWLTAKTGEAGRFSEPFIQTDAHAKVLAWKISQPAAGSNHREFKTWRNAGYDLLKGDLDHPWGMCQCGNEKLLPWQDKKTFEWRVSKLGRDCYMAQVDVPVSTKSRKKTLVLQPEPLTPEEIEARRKAARELNEKNRLDKKARRRAGAEGSAKRSQSHEDGGLKSIRKHEKEVREQGGHPEGKKGKKGGKKK